MEGSSGLTDGSILREIFFTVGCGNYGDDFFIDVDTVAGRRPSGHWHIEMVCASPAVAEAESKERRGKK